MSTQSKSKRASSHVRAPQVIFPIHSIKRYAEYYLLCITVVWWNIKAIQYNLWKHNGIELTSEMTSLFKDTPLNKRTFWISTRSNRSKIEETSSHLNKFLRYVIVKKATDTSESEIRNEKDIPFLFVSLSFFNFVFFIKGFFIWGSFAWKRDWSKMLPPSAGNCLSYIDVCKNGVEVVLVDFVCEVFVVCWAFGWGVIALSSRDAFRDRASS